MSNKTAIIYYGGFVRFGGVLSHVRALEEELRKIGWDVTVITLDNLPVWFRYLPHIVEKFVNFYRKPLGFFYKGYVTKLLYKLRYNIEVDVRIFEDVYIGWNSKIPSISILHAVWSDNLQSFALSDQQKKRLISLEADCINRLRHPVVTVSHQYLKYLKEQHFYSYDLKEIDVVELGIDQSEFTENKKTERDIKSIIYCGSLERRKNVYFLLEVFNKIYSIDSSYKLTIIGDGPDRSFLEEFVKNNRLPVAFLGRLTHDKVISELYLHGLYLHTSVKESFSYSLLEAKLAGLITFAYSGLQVPGEFIDVAIDAFDVDIWCNEIVSHKMVNKNFNYEKYTAERMTLLTLELAQAQQLT